MMSNNVTMMQNDKDKLIHVLLVDELIHNEIKIIQFMRRKKLN